ncbi:hypothetical protein BpHYR1_052453 [Brachionus plicatilis]|uniref:Uncharacterized protein n=1 Tax=Brachionus plicatilis TaxID=10195 RepID=A0A3M7QYW3_BRAPC|nr:hypothetical protein BpHYR1_052453 [Brachionus plicatilis]
MSVEEISYRTSIRAKGTFLIQQAFNGILTLLLAIYVIEEQFRLTLKGPDNRFFKLTYRLSDRRLELLANHSISCSEFGIERGRTH